MKKLVYILLVLTAINIAVGIYVMTKQQEVVERSDTVEVVRYDTIKDTLPVVKKEKVTKYITLKDSIHDTITNEIVLPIVQRTYTDDSTYTAYVSGAKIDSFPRLDSIMVRQRTIERTITNTIIKKKHWRFGIGINGGISIITGKPDVTAGVFAGYTF